MAAYFLAGIVQGSAHREDSEATGGLSRYGDANDMNPDLQLPDAGSLQALNTLSPQALLRDRLRDLRALGPCAGARGGGDVAGRRPECGRAKKIVSPSGTTRKWKKRRRIQYSTTI